MIYRSLVVAVHRYRKFCGGAELVAVTSHVVQSHGERLSAIDGRTTRHPGYDISQPPRGGGWLGQGGGRFARCS
jgi:hypothetical protein